MTHSTASIQLPHCFNFNSGFFSDVASFGLNNKSFILATAGMALPAYTLGNLGGRIVAKVWTSLGGTVRKTHDVALPRINALQSCSLPWYTRLNRLCSRNITHHLSFQWALWKTPHFNGYQLKEQPGTTLRETTVRPNNLLLEACFKSDPSIQTTQPGTALFAFTCPSQKIVGFLKKNAGNWWDSRVHVCAKGKSGNVGGNHIADLSSVYGSKTFSFSRKELSQDRLKQKIFVSGCLPLNFYKALKLAMTEDHWILLPEKSAHTSLKLGEIDSLFSSHKHVKTLLQKIKKDPTKYGFKNAEHFNTFLSLSLYQIGAMVVKSQPYHALVDGEGKIVSRSANANDAINLIDVCGIRPGANPGAEKFNRNIMKETFRTAILASGDGALLAPAIGMGVWGGNPNLYWRALLDALCESGTKLELICINPGHRPSPHGRYKGCKGEEFQLILDEYKAKHAGNTQALTNLDKIKNLQGTGKDLVQFARNLAKSYHTSLLNASDPDVTLGNHVGEYSNGMGAAPTTEENYFVIGDNALRFEGITEVLNDPKRLIQC